MTGKITSINGNTIQVRVITTQTTPYQRTNVLYNVASSTYVAFDTSSRSLLTFSSSNLPANSFIWDIQYMARMSDANTDITVDGTFVTTLGNVQIISQAYSRLPPASEDFSVPPPAPYNRTDTAGFANKGSVYLPTSLPFRFNYAVPPQFSVENNGGDQIAFGVSGTNTYAGIVRGYSVSYSFGTIETRN
jgi:hypothetical protein